MFEDSSIDTDKYLADCLDRYQEECEEGPDTWRCRLKERGLRNLLWYLWVIERPERWRNFWYDRKHPRPHYSDTDPFLPDFPGFSE